MTLLLMGVGGATDGPPAGGGSTTTLNPSDKSATTTLSGGNLIATQATGYGGVRSISSYSSGKKYMEFVPSVGPNAFDHLIGIATAAHTINSGPDSSSAGWFAGSTTVDGNGGSIGTGMSAYAVPGYNIGMAVDIGNNRIWFRANGGLWNFNASGDPVANVGGFDISYMTGPFFVWVIGNGANAAVENANFGASAYAFTPPSGYSNW
jgi:hypothetical protein